METDKKQELSRELHALRFFKEGGFYVCDITLIHSDSGDSYQFTDIPHITMSDELSDYIIDAMTNRCKDIEEALTNGNKM